MRHEFGHIASFSFHAIDSLSLPKVQAKTRNHSLCNEQGGKAGGSKLSDCRTGLNPTWDLLPGSWGARTTGQSHTGLPWHPQSEFPSWALLPDTAANVPAGLARGKPSPANHAMALLRFLQLLAIQDICVCSVTHNRGLFSLEGLHHCLSPGAYHVSIFFSLQGRSACCYFQHHPHVLQAIHA